MAGQRSRIVVPVLGMHRSGTSLTTGILNALGVSLSEDLMPATQANAIGYFESVGITAIHDQLLAVLGSSWRASETLKPFPQNWWRLGEVAPFKEKLKTLVARENARVEGVWGFKDPRTARLLPLWEDIFSELGLEPRYVLVGRHPLDVAKSLQNRDGLHPLQSELLWLEHTTDAVLHGRQHLRAIVEYSRWFEDPVREAEYLISSLGFEMPDRAALENVTQRLVSAELRHHASTDEAFALPFSRDMYQALARRDRTTLEMLADLFQVTSTFSSRVLEFQSSAGARQMTVQQLSRAIEELQDVSESDVAEFLNASDASVRLAARGALARSAIRRALYYCGELARDQHYSEQSTVSAIERLVTLSDWDEPYIETLKQVGIQAANAGNVNAAMQYLQEAVFRGFASGQRRDARSRKAMRYAHDIEIDAAIERVAALYPAPKFNAASGKLKLSILCTALADEDGPTVLTVKRAAYFRDDGFDVEIVSTELGSSANTKMAARVKAMGIPFTVTPSGTWDERIRWLVKYFDEHPTDIIVYMTSAQDCLAKLAACIGLSRVQSWDVRALEPQIGKFDLINHGLSKEQEIHTRWPGLARCTGPGHAMAEEVASAEPYSREELGLPADAILLATFGRMEKGNTPEYLEATAQILRSVSRARLLLAGPDSLNAIPAMLQYYSQCGVADRVHYLGRRQADGPRLIKTIDVYCETYPWPGGQSLFDAMEAARPIVAMKRAQDAQLDPTGTGATTSVADVVLSGVVPLAAAGNVQDYVSIALQYINDERLRQEHGRTLRDKVRRDCNLRVGTALYGSYLRELCAQKQSA